MVAQAESALKSCQLLSKIGDLSVALAYLVITCICTYPMIFNLGNPLGPPEDNQLFLWNLWWFKFALVELGSSPFRTDYLFYPEGANLYLHTLSPLNCIVSLLLQPVFGLVATYNVLIALTFVVAAFGGYKLFRYLNLDPLAAFIGGQIFSFNPFHLAHAAHHLNISSVHLLPFLILVTLRAIEGQKKKHVIWGALLLAAQYYLDFYILSFALILLVGLLFFSPGRGLTIPNWHSTKVIGVILMGGFVLAAPLLFPAIKQALAGRFTRPGGYDVYAADLAAFFLPYPTHWLKLPWFDIPQLYRGNVWESTVFLGFVVLPLAVWGAFYRSFRYRWYLVTIALGGILLALGSDLYFMGKRLGIPILPSAIFQHLPILNSVRSLGRFVFLTYLGLAGLAAYCVTGLLAWCRRKRRWLANTLFCILVAAVMLDYWSVPFPITRLPVPKFYESIRQQPGKFAVVNIPPIGWEPNERYMYYQIYHQKPLCGGILARFDGSYFDRLQSIPLAADAFQKQGIRYIVIHEHFLPPGQYASWRRGLSERFAVLAEENGQFLLGAF